MPPLPDSANFRVDKASCGIFGINYLAGQFSLARPERDDSAFCAIILNSNGT